MKDTVRDASSPVESDDLTRGEFAYLRMRAAIKSGEFKSGQRIREAELAKRFNISRTPVREAIRRVVSDGLIEEIPGKGLTVKQYTVQQVRELYYLRAVLEGAAASQAAQFASSSEVKVLEDLLTACRSNLGKPTETARINSIFHQTIHDSARNQFLKGALSNLSDLLALLPGTTFESPGRPVTALDEHMGIVAAVKSRKGDTAEKLARQHIFNAMEVRVSMMFGLG